jgi:peptide/nickel transport system permease protein
VAFFSVILGTICGLLSGYYKKVDAILMRVLDGVMSIPALLLALALVAALGGNMTNIIIALTFACWPVMTRVVRSSTLQIRNIQFIEAAKTTGVKDVIILFRYILPNAITPIIVQGSVIFARAILAEAALSFLGVGIQPPTPTWGNILGDSRIYLTIAPWYSIFPGMAIVITVLALNVLGDRLRDMMDPHSTKKRTKRHKRKMDVDVSNTAGLYKKRA